MKKYKVVVTAQEGAPAWENGIPRLVWATKRSRKQAVELAERLRETGLTVEIKEVNHEN